MDKKYLYIGGGVSAVAVVGVLLVRHAKAKAAASQDGAQQTTPQVMADTGYFSGMAPASGGVTSPVVVDPGTANNTGGGFDISSLLGALITNQTKANQDQVVNNAHNNDSAILATVIGNNNSSATVTHSENGTTVTMTPNGDMYDQTIASIYKAQLGNNRVPDSGGMAFFKNAMMNQGASVLDVTKAIQNSDEYKQLHPA